MLHVHLGRPITTSTATSAATRKRRSDTKPTVRTSARAAGSPPTAWLRFADQLRVGPTATCWKSAAAPGDRPSTSQQSADARSQALTSTTRGRQRAATRRGARPRDRVRFREVDASQPLPFAAASFDAVVSNDAMCHIANRLEVLRDWHRVLRPRGRMLFTERWSVTGWCRTRSSRCVARSGSTCSCLLERTSA